MSEGVTAPSLVQLKTGHHFNLSALHRLKTIRDISVFDVENRHQSRLVCGANDCLVVVDTDDYGLYSIDDS